MHAAACAQAGAAAITLSIAAVSFLSSARSLRSNPLIYFCLFFKIRDWHRDRGSGVNHPDEDTGEDSDDAIRDAQTIAAYFGRNDISSPQLLACDTGHVRRPSYCLIAFARCFAHIAGATTGGRRVLSGRARCAEL